jgi:hypothetical protein
MRSVTLGEYRNQMHAFTTGHLGADDFEAGYLRLRQEDSATRPDGIARILEDVASGLKQPDLMERVTAALRTLDTLRHGPPP